MRACIEARELEPELGAHRDDTPALCELFVSPEPVARGAVGGLNGEGGTIETASDGTRRARPRCDASRRDLARRCGWCRGAIAVTARRDALYCSKRCRQAAHRFGKACRARARATQPIRLAYADPPYPGLARRYYAEHPDYAGEVDHAELIRRLSIDYDGWALSTSSRALPDVLAICASEGVRVRVAAWVRGARPTSSAWPLSAWEPVVFAGGRREPSRDVAHDALVCGSRPRRTDPGRIIGAKPARVIFWIFDLLGARPGDELHDLFPGSGGVARAWRLFEASALQGDASPLEHGHASARDLRDGSARAVDARRLEGGR